MRFLTAGMTLGLATFYLQRMEAIAISLAMRARYLMMGWDMLIVAHPPCTRLCNSGVRWLHTPPPGRTLEEMWTQLDEGAQLFSAFWNAPIERICVENPVMHRHAKERIVNYVNAAQSVQPWQFGHGETKRTCFWLKNLPPLIPTKIVDGRVPRVHHASPSPDRWKERSRFFPGIAAAMAKQWGDHFTELGAAQVQSLYP